MTTRQKKLQRLASDLDAVTKQAQNLGLDLAVYILVMAKLELAREVGEREFDMPVATKPVSQLQ